MWNFFSPRLTAKYEIRTRMTKQTVLYTVAKANNEYSAAGIKYGSRVGEDGFKLYHLHKQLRPARETFQPMAAASIREESEQTVISVIIQAKAIEGILIRLAYLSILFAILTPLIGWFTGGNHSDALLSDALFGTLFFIVFHAIVWFAYKKPAAKLKDYLDELLLL